ncbi:hypothetical protein I0Q91_10730 [Halanaerobiaceae bacterium Z-7014]|uniref:Uncharacterized protein n=1 Tax=Halonatronomonas betaini TaxID=2778430 RepID=A0A931AVQ4_9FIRM|nr:hypothetical protein [Halonatronomonas betaini]
MQNFKSSLFIALLTFWLAVVVSFLSQTRITDLDLLPAFFVLLLIIITGILSDMVGVAATVAREEPFNAMASKKISGAKIGLWLVRRGDKVASLMCDIIGDICGTVSGAIGAIIVLQILEEVIWPETIVNLLMIGFIASLTVGGKAFCKYYGIKKAEEITFNVSRFLNFIKVSRIFIKEVK